MTYIWLLTAGRWSFFQRQVYDDFYDTQARAWLDGRWDMPRDVVGLEGIAVDDKVQIYFGPVPSLLRLPVLLLTDRFDGRLTTLSMLAAMLVLAVAAFRLTVAVRRLVRPEAPVTRSELVLTGALAVAVLAGPPYWLASLATVHHEAVLWGVALLVAAFDAIVRWALEPCGRRLVAASALVAATLLTRNTLGTGALVALVVTGGVLVGATLLDLKRARASYRPGVVLAALLMAACIVPLAVSVVPNLARFGHPFEVPFDRQLGMNAPEWRQHLDHNEGVLYGPRYAPTTLVTYLRPDALSFRSDLPWVDYPRADRNALAGGTVLVDVTSSIPVTTPLLSLLAIPGAVVLVRSLARRDPPIWLIGLGAGSLVATIGVMLLGSVAHRYLNDLFPAVLVPGLVGYHVFVGATGRWTRRVATRMAIAGTMLLALGAATLTTLLALQYQREHFAFTPEAWRSAWATTRADAPGANSPWHVGLGDPLPTNAPHGTAMIVGDCAGLYVWVADPVPVWLPVERGPDVEVYDLRVDLDSLRSLPLDQRAPLLTREDADGISVVTIARSSQDEAQIDVWDSAESTWRTGSSIPIESGKAVRISADSRANLSALAHGEEHHVGVQISPPRGDAVVAFGEAPGAMEDVGILREYPGAVTLDPVEPRACRALDGD
jgi:hypothetical protein